MAKASAHKLSYALEATRGVANTNPRWQLFPDSRTTLNINFNNLPNPRLNGSRIPDEPRRGAGVVNGDVQTVLSALAYDDLLASVFQGAWTQVHVGEDTVEIDVDLIGAVVSSVGDTFATTNGTVTVERIDGKLEETVLRYDPTIVGPAVTYVFRDATAQDIDGESFVVDTYVDVAEEYTLDAGETRSSFSILREFSDFAPGKKPFLMYLGCECNTLSLRSAADNIVEATFGIFGESMVGPSTTAPTNSSYAPAIDTQPFSSFKGSFKIDSVAQCIITDFTLNINNGLAPRFTVGCPNSKDPEVGQSLIDGSATAYFEDETLYEKFVNDTKLAFELTMEDDFSNKRILNLPRLTLLPGTAPDVTADGSVTIALNFSAHLSDALGTHARITRLDSVLP